MYINLIVKTVADTYWVYNSTIREKPKPQLPEIRVIVERIIRFGNRRYCAFDICLRGITMISLTQFPADLFTGPDASM